MNEHKSIDRIIASLCGIALVVIAGGRALGKF